MIDRVKNLKRHLREQIRAAERIDSQFVYIRLSEAKQCLELAEAEDVITEMLQEHNKKEK